MAWTNPKTWSFGEILTSTDMNTYVRDNTLELFSNISFDARTVITATDATWSVPTLGPNTIVRVTCIGGGGGGGGVVANGGAGGTTTFNASTAGTVTASGGVAGRAPAETGMQVGTAGFAAGNGGTGSSYVVSSVKFQSGTDGRGGQIVVAYLDLEGISTVNVTIGAGGSAGSTYFTWQAAAGGRGEVIVEYVAG